MTYQFENPLQEQIFGYLKKAKTIAIVGLSNRRETASYEVATILQEYSYCIIPVNPKLAGSELLGEKVYGSIKDIPFHIDIVDIFRRPEFLADVAKDFIETDFGVFWTQIGLESEGAEKILRKANRNDIVMNRCTKIEYQALIRAEMN